MWASRGSTWGPRPLPEFLQEQLSNSGYLVDDSGRVAREINEQSTGSGSASLFVDLGSCKFLEGDIDGAIAAWRHAISSNEDAAAARALLNLGLLYEHLHLHDRALGLLATVADRNIEPYVVPAAMASARCQVARGDSEHAMETMARLAQATMTHHPDGPELIETLYGLGDVAEGAGRTDRAERSWRVAAASPSSAMQRAAADRLAQLLADLGHEDELPDLLENQHDVTGPDGAAVLVDRAEALCRLGDTNGAYALLEATDGSELSLRDRFRVAAAKVQCGQVNSAIDEYEGLLSHSDGEVQLRAAFTLGELYQSYDMSDAASSMFGRAITANNRYWTPKASLALGDLLRDAGDSADAISHWQRAATSDIRLVAEQAQARLATSDITSANESAAVAPAPAASAPVAPAPVAAATVVQATSSPVAAPAPAASLAEPQIISLNDIDDAVVPAEPEPLEPEPVEHDLTEPEPVIVVLSALEDDTPSLATDDDVIDLSDRATAARIRTAATERTPSAFASHLGEAEPANPYASLAPDDEVRDSPATTRNPYAELAPNYDDDEFEPAAGVEPGDWESMLEWPLDTSGKSTKRSSAFSRYT